MLGEVTDGALDSLGVNIKSAADTVSYRGVIVAARLSHRVTWEGQLSNVQIISCSLPILSLAQSYRLSATMPF